MWYFGSIFITICIGISFWHFLFTDLLDKRSQSAPSDTIQIVRGMSADRLGFETMKNIGTVTHIGGESAYMRIRTSEDGQKNSYDIVFEIDESTRVQMTQTHYNDNGQIVEQRIENSSHDPSPEDVGKAVLVRYFAENTNLYAEIINFF